jgi:hypothetical protein
MTTDAAIRRLRAANPVPDVPPTHPDADALFERITLGPSAARVPRVRRYRRPAVLVAAALAVAAVLASSAYAIQNWLFGGGVVRAPVTQSEYLRAQKLLELPPGYRWPSYHFQANTVMNRGAGGSIAVSIDQVAWECYWAQAIRQGDGSAGRRARRELGDLMTHRIHVAPAGASENWAPPASTPWPYLVYADDGGYQYKQRIYAAAAAGDPEPLAQSCRANAPNWGSRAG